MQAALACERAGRAAEAEALYGEVLETAPAHAGALHRLGILAMRGGRLAESAELFRKAVTSDPEAWTSHAHLGLALRRLRRPAEAVAAYDAALALRPGDPELLNGRGVALLDLGKAEAALAAFEAATAARPDFAPAHANRGLALLALRRPQEALEPLGEALALDPAQAGAHYSLGNALMELGRFVDALRAYDAAVAQAPRHALAHYGRGRALAELQFIGAGSPPEAALEAFDRAIALDPGAAHARFARGLARLRLGRWREGWEDYEHRWRTASFVQVSSSMATADLRRRLDLDVQPADLAGQRVLLVAEQGVGDVIMFASMIPDLQAIAGSVALLCETRLHPLFAASFPGLELVAPGAPLPPHDRVLALGSLGRLFRNEPDSFPRAPYLAASEPARARWAARLGAEAGLLRIGLSWRGGAASTGRAARSLDLAQLRPLLDLPGCDFVSLQHGDVAGELAAENAGRARPIWAPPPDEVADFDDFAGVVQAMDLIVSVQNSLVHLSGALGAPALVMIPRKPEWRYGAAGETMPWYGSIRLLRQGRDGEWGPVISQVVEAVRQRLG
jgi:tetratricopeptide (TPR) repeat protein